MTQFTADRALGATLGNSHLHDRVLWNVGFHYRTDSDLDERFLSNHGYGLTARVAGLLFENPDEGARLHLGVGYNFKVWETDEFFNLGIGLDDRARSGVVLGTGAFSGTRATHTFAPEFLWTFRSLAIQAEYYATVFDNDFYGNPFLQGSSIQLGWWMTGERPAYARSRGVLGRLDPARKWMHLNCYEMSTFCGPGAFQWVYRFDWLDLSDFAGPLAGQMFEHTVGLNWFPTSNCRVLFDYTAARRDYRHGPDRFTNLFSVGMQFYY